MIRLLLASFLGASTLSAAMIVGFGAEADYYSVEADGSFNYENTRTHFNNDQESSYQLGAYLEHPIPLVPNIRIDYTPKTTFSGFDGVGESNDVDFTQLDTTLYYEILDNVVDLDIGVSGKYLSGHVQGVNNKSFDEIIPMGYLRVAFTRPLTGLSFDGNVKYVEYEGDSLLDARVKATWNIMLGLGVQAGYRYESMDIDDRFDMNTDASFRGPFVGVQYIF